MLARFHFGITLLAVAIATLSVFFAGVAALRGYADANLQLGARLAAYAVEPALTFDDADAARDSLAALDRIPGLRRIEVRANDGGLMVAWTASTPDPMPRVSALLFPRPVSQPVLRGDVRIGAVRIWGDARAMRSYVVLGLIVAAICLLLTGIGGAVIARRFASQLRLRFAAIADVAHDVRLHRRFERRVAPQPIVEFDRLGKDLNALLDELQGWQDMVEAEKAELSLAADRDALTGLYNRAAFDRLLAAAVADSARGDSGLALLYLDLDGFKRVNDAYGHGIGDALLARIGQHIAAQLGPDDIAARIGGDEFAVAVHRRAPSATAGHAGDLCADLARRIADLSGCGVDVGGECATVSVSVGTAHYPGDGDSAAKLLYAADFQMYRAKHGVSGN